MSLTFSEIESLWFQASFTPLLTQCLYIDIESQTLNFFKDKKLKNIYTISSAKNGIGNHENSFQTPRGFHYIDEKIGDNQPINMLFKGRQATGELAQIDDPMTIENDSICSRILWLSGLEQGINLSGDVDTKNRYIYIHGTADEMRLGQAVSHGCIRMKNTEIIDLFSLVKEGCVVYIA